MKDASCTTVPPLKVIALFSQAVPELSATASGTLDPDFELLRFDGPGEVLATDLDDPLQPLTSGERDAVAAARGGLQLRWSNDMQPVARLAACVKRLRLLHDLGAIAIVLPAALKVIGPTALRDSLDGFGDQAEWVKLFTHQHLVREQDSVWCHTHGMEHFGLPDVECRTAAADEWLAQRLVYGVAAHLLSLGSDSLPVGEILQATEPDGRSLGRLQVHRPRPVENHAYGAWGALQIIPIGEPMASQSSEASGVGPRSQLMRCVENKQRAHDLDLRATDLAGLHVGGLRGHRLDLSYADLHAAKLTHARLGDCRLEGAQLEATDWSAATLHTCTLDSALLARACFEDARLEDSSAQGAIFANANLRSAKLSETAFERAVLREACLDAASGEGVVFRGADLSKASLVGAQFDDADFRGADLRGANLEKGSFRGADFRGALLDDARFADADCAGAQFDAQHRATHSAADGGPSRSNVGDTALAELLQAFERTVAADNATRDPVDAMVDLFRQIAHAFEKADEQPPEAWKPWLKPLMGRMRSGQPLDLPALLSALQGTPLEHMLAEVGPSAAQLVDQLKPLAAEIEQAAQSAGAGGKLDLETLLKLGNDAPSNELNAAFAALASLITGACRQSAEKQRSNNDA